MDTSRFLTVVMLVDPGNYAGRVRFGEMESARSNGIPVPDYCAHLVPLQELEPGMPGAGPLEDFGPIGYVPRFTEGRMRQGACRVMGLRIPKRLVWVWVHYSWEQGDYKDDLDFYYAVYNDPGRAAVVRGGIGICNLRGYSPEQECHPVILRPGGWGVHDPGYCGRVLAGPRMFRAFMRADIRRTYDTLCERVGDTHRGPASGGEARTRQRGRSAAPAIPHFSDLLRLTPALLRAMPGLPVLLVGLMGLMVGLTWLLASHLGHSAGPLGIFDLPGVA